MRVGDAVSYTDVSATAMLEHLQELASPGFVFISGTQSLRVQSLTSYLSTPRALGDGVKRRRLGLACDDSAPAISAASAAPHTPDSAASAAPHAPAPCAFRIVKANPSQNKLVSVAADAWRNVSGDQLAVTAHICEGDVGGDEAFIQAAPVQAHEGLADLAVVRLADSKRVRDDLL